jgi:hypothetical protein
MQSSSASITAALNDEEVCPLCLDRYTAADECTCVVCRAPSCPSCAENIDADGAMRCFACRPPIALHAPQKAARAPTPLPRPIAISSWPSAAAARVEGEPPPLPFPLTTSPHGVRKLNPRPVGSVFVGLPPVSPALSSALQPPPTAPQHAAAQPLMAQARAELTLLSRRAEQSLRVVSSRSKQSWQTLQRELPVRAARLRSWLEVKRARLAVLRAQRLNPALGQMRTSLLQLTQHPLPRRTAARLREQTRTLRAQLPVLLRAWAQRGAAQLARLRTLKLPKSLAALITRPSQPPVFGPPSPQRDRSSSISL